jgi:hypothetical protein
MTLATEATDERFTFAPSRADSVHEEQVQPSVLQTLLSPFIGVMTSCTGTP